MPICMAVLLSRQLRPATHAATKVAPACHADRIPPDCIVLISLHTPIVPSADQSLCKFKTYIKYSTHQTAYCCTQIDPATLPAPVPWPSIHVPWYGYLFWTVAAFGGYCRTADASFVPVKIGSTASRSTTSRSASCAANIKVRTSAAWGMPSGSCIEA
jgi:hypothetical protein